MGHWLEVRAFEDADVEGAAELLTERHERHRAAEPLLAPAEDAAALVARAWRKEGTSGAVAVGEGEVAGYPARHRRRERVVEPARVDRARRPCRARARARPRPLPLRRRALGGGRRRAPRRARARPARAGRALVPARLRAHAGPRHPGERRQRPAPLPRITVRFGTIDDLRATPALVTQIWEHHRQAPTFTGLTVPPVEEFLVDWEKTLELPASATSSPSSTGRVVGHTAPRAGRARPRAAAGLDLPRRRGHPAGGTRQRRGRGAHGARPRVGPRGRLRVGADRLARRQPGVVPLLAAPRLPGDVLPAGAAREHRLSPGLIDTLPAQSARHRCASRR